MHLNAIAGLLAVLLSCLSVLWHSLRPKPSPNEVTNGGLGAGPVLDC